MVLPQFLSHNGQALNDLGLNKQLMATIFHLIIELSTSKPSVLPSCKCSGSIHGFLSSKNLAIFLTEWQIGLERDSLSFLYPAHQVLLVFKFVFFLSWYSSISNCRCFHFLSFIGRNFPVIVTISNFYYLSCLLSYVLPIWSLSSEHTSVQHYSIQLTK